MLCGPGADSVDAVEVDIFERLPTLYGLIRAGVAPDHQHTKSVVRMFDTVFRNKRVACHLNVQVGADLTHDELMAHHHAVIYAVGASLSRDLGIPGEQLPGNHSAVDFVGWYNGHPDHTSHEFDLSGERVVIAGNGNVALDVARVSGHAARSAGSDRRLPACVGGVESQQHSRSGDPRQKGPRDAAFSAAEFLALGNLPGVDIVIEGASLEDSENDGVETELKLRIAREYAGRATDTGNKRIVFRFLTSPAEIVETDRASGLRVVANTLDGSGALIEGHADGETETIETPLILRSIGCRGSAIEGLPFDDVRAVVPNDRGRVTDDGGEAIPGVYVTGWIKRGPRGVIGTNRSCATETVERLLEDFAEGRLQREVAGRAEIEALLAERAVKRLDWAAWKAIDTAERQRGADAARPRIKFVDVAEMLEAAGHTS